ncbi:hypothetical protein [Natronorubrum tibetense]|uniref:hypothetical protein n=1 Tax=Natronorubrum tibetense TaxID=63128 RepID=UPI001F4C63CB|nr:hypothetical protein [Natronorubrum tibetense]
MVLALFWLDWLPDVLMGVLQLVLYAYVVYQTPNYFTKNDSSKWSPFWALVTGIVISGFLFWSRDPTPNTLLLLVILSLTTWLLLTGIVYAWSKAIDNQSEPQQMFSQILIANTGTMDQPPAGANTGAISLLIGGMVMLFVCFTILAISVAEQQFPILEVLVVGVATYDMIARRVALLPEGPRIKTDLLDTLFTTFGSVLTTPLKGMMTVFMVLVGLLLAVTPFSLERETMFAFGKVLSEGTVPTDAHIIVSLSVILYAVYGLWFWLRVLDRMPAFLTSYRRDEQERFVTGKKRITVTPLPRFWIVPTVVLSGGTVGLLAFFSQFDAEGITVWTLGIIGFYALGAMSIGESFKRTRESSTEARLGRDNWWLPSAFLVYLLGFMLLSNALSSIESGVTSGMEFELTAGHMSSEQVGQAALVFILLFYMDDVYRYARRFFDTTWFVGYLYSLLVLAGIRFFDTPVSNLYDLYEFFFFIFGVGAVYIIHLKPFVKSADVQRSLAASTAFLLCVLFVGQLFNVFLYAWIGAVCFLYTLQHVFVSSD